MPGEPLQTFLLTFRERPVPSVRAALALVGEHMGGSVLASVLGPVPVDVVPEGV